jgi:thioredoxin 1
VYTGTKFCKLDVDEVPEVAQELNIRAMPTIVLFKDGKKVTEVVGANQKAIEAAIKKIDTSSSAKEEKEEKEEEEA